MTKSELIERLLQQAPHVAHKDVEMIVDTIFTSMTHALEKGGRVEIRGFGSFEVRVRDPRVGRNPKSGQKVQVTRRRVPFFKAGKELKERINHPQHILVPASQVG